MSSSISGNTQVPANIAYKGGNLSGNVVSNSTAPIGDYTIGDLPDGIYTLTPAALNYTFTPSSQVVTVAGSNVTGVNFTATVTVGNFTGTVVKIAEAAQVTEGGRTTLVSTSLGLIRFGDGNTLVVFDILDGSGRSPVAPAANTLNATVHFDLRQINESSDPSVPRLVPIGQAINISV